MKDVFFSLKEALNLMMENIRPLSAEHVSLVDSVDRIAADDLYARVDSPSVNSSLKDGFAVLSRDIDGATVQNPVRLHVLGSMAAGCEENVHIRSGTAVRILTGARIPTGADVVVADEFVTRSGDDILIDAAISPGRNILQKGGDVSNRKHILRAEQQISPVMAGLLAAAGHHRIPVIKNPVVGIIGTGSELVEPGNALSEGQLYASNIVTLAGWCKKYRMTSCLAIVRDDPTAIFDTVRQLSDRTDAIITSGGAWTGDFDWVARVLQELGWKELFHRIRIGPGKAVGLGLLNRKPVFILPGAPPSNLIGFLQIALPGLLVLAGHVNPGLPVIHARLASDLGGGKSDWTDFFFGTLGYNDDLPVFSPMKKRSRLSSIARASAIAVVPEGMERLSTGAVIPVQLLK